ncbi:MAG: hypothetical protein WAM09_13100, partial [Anaerolineales bacterium]
MKNRLSTLLVFIVIASFIMSACATATTAAPAATNPPAATAAPTTPPTQAAQLGTADNPIIVAFEPSATSQEITAGGQALLDLLSTETGLT